MLGMCVAQVSITFVPMLLSFVRSVAFTAVTMKSIIFRDVANGSMAEIYRYI
jgi:hypothetical protein